MGGNRCQPGRLASGAHAVRPRKALPLSLQMPGRLLGDLLDGGTLYTLLEVKVLTARYRQTYNCVRPHSSLGYRPPAH